MLYSGDPGRLEADRLLDLVHLTDYQCLHDIYLWWRRFVPAPARRQIDPTRIRPDVLRRTILLDYLPPDTFRTRLAGTALCIDRGGELRGRTLDEIHDAGEVEIVKRPYLEVVRTWKPDFRLRRYRSARQLTRTYARLALPLSEDHTSVTGLMVCALAVVMERGTGNLRRLPPDDGLDTMRLGVMP